ncbi:Arm DNA-binding domain-containing protein [Phyllobacterium sp. LjRoot231]|uniref:Arm DNA-binding domain-containing protein n=1 Tax=Phyllobacterium sp. LjRoot231 TaxID=3342289 RepID=UPI003ECDD25E
MPRKAQELGPLHIKRLIEPGIHFVGGVSGLQLQVKDTGARSWLLRVQIGGKRRHIGLGGMPAISMLKRHISASATFSTVHVAAPYCVIAALGNPPASISLINFTKLESRSPKSSKAVVMTSLSTLILQHDRTPINLVELNVQDTLSGAISGIIKGIFRFTIQYDKPLIGKLDMLAFEYLLLVIRRTRPVQRNAHHNLAEAVARSSCSERDYRANPRQSDRCYLRHTREGPTAINVKSYFKEIQ